MEIRRMTSKNNKAPPFGYIKLCALFQSHHWIQTVVIVRNRLFPVKIGDFWSRMTYKIWRMTLKAMGQFFYATSSCVYHFVVLHASCSMESMVRWVNCNGRASRHEINNYNANADVFYEIGIHVFICSGTWFMPSGGCVLMLEISIYSMQKSHINLSSYNRHPITRILGWHMRLSNKYRENEIVSQYQIVASI